MTTLIKTFAVTIHHDQDQFKFKEFSNSVFKNNIDLASTKEIYVFVKYVYLRTLILQCTYFGKLNLYFPYVIWVQKFTLKEQMKPDFYFYFQY